MLLDPFGAGIWIADGPPVRTFGFRFPTRMIVVRLGNGDLWINSPVDAPDAAIASLERVGPVRHLVAPTTLHVWRLRRWHATFPNARVWVPSMLSDESPAEWKDDLDQVVFRGNAFLDEVHFFHRASRTLVVADFVQRYPDQAGHPLRNALMHLLGVGGRGGVPIDIRLSMLDRSLARSSMRRILSWDFDRLIIAHGLCLEGDARAYVQQVFRWLRA